VASDGREIGILAGWLRMVRGWNQTEMGTAARLDPSAISRYESGEVAPPRANLERMAGAAGVPVELIDALLLPAIRAVLAAGGESPGERRCDPGAAADELGVAVGGMLRAALGEFLAEVALAERAEAPGGAAAGEGRRQAADRSAIERLCEESEQAAADDTTRAHELAGLALRIAEVTPGDPGWRARAQGFVWGFVGNARRVEGDLVGAEAAFDEAWRLSKTGPTGAEPDGPEFARWRLLDLQASLRRAQRRFPEALRLLDEARAAAPPEAAGRIEFKRASTLELAGEIEAALETLGEVLTLLKDSDDPRMQWGAHFHLATNLCLLGRHAEAEELLPVVCEGAQALGNQLDSIRARWLSGRVAAGQGRDEEAGAAFEEVRREFVARGNGYDAALVSLELAAVELERGRTRKVRALAEEMVGIFGSLGVRREAAAALGVFVQAAKSESATVELVRRTLRQLERGRQERGGGLGEAG
jgi:tetratricopeptide (TPR) repeat protein